MTDEEIAACLERLELKLDIGMLQSTGMTRTEAESRVYGPKIMELIADLQAAVRELQGKVE